MLWSGAFASERRQDVRTPATWPGARTPSGEGLTRCGTTLGLPGQCVGTHMQRDGLYQCLDRSDENPYSRKKDSPLDFSRLEPCTTLGDESGGDPGLSCSGARDGKCLELVSWCLEGGWLDEVVTCDELGGLPSNLPELCGNTTFWTQYPCGYYQGFGPWTRCTGRNSGECVFEGGMPCSDKSDIYRNSTDGPCTATEFSCHKYNASVCLHEELRCDQHPQCDQGEDELGCEAAYREKGYTATNAFYACESPHHNSGSASPSVVIWATRCDHRRECYGGADEEFCNLRWVVYIVIGLIFIS